MSFEPTLIIRKSDLDKHKEILEEERWDDDKETSRVAKFLIEEIRGGSIKFKEIEIIISKPELTGFNQSVRNRLDELNVEYKLEA